MDSKDEQDPSELDHILQKLLKIDITAVDDKRSTSSVVPSASSDCEERGLSYQDVLAETAQIRQAIQRHPYALPFYILLAQRYAYLSYLDLAAGAAYKALLLSDAIQSEEDEYHECTVEACVDMMLRVDPEERQPGSKDVQNEDDDHETLLDRTSELQTILMQNYLPEIYQLLASNLCSCECFRSAFTYSSQGLRLFPADSNLLDIHSVIQQKVAARLSIDITELQSGERRSPSSWLDYGFVRRELYPWNTYEPSRFEELSTLNAMMQQVAPKLEVLPIELPDLTTNPNDQDASVVMQLGVFAKEDIPPGENILSETTMLTANNKLQDALCDACSADLPGLKSSVANTVVSCPDCEVIFCSESCMENALKSYHPAVCDRDVEAIAKDVPPAEAADALYSLLLLRALAMAETQQCHPLELKEVKYIWGDFHHQPIGSISEAKDAPKTLPFSFENNIRLPLHMLEKMDIDIFANPQYDVWVFNTLYAKFRGTASARLSGLGGRPARGPEVSAVHPMWCLANHSCDPNVSWDWGGSVTFRARDRRNSWDNLHGDTVKAKEPGIRKGEEVLNHYCDVDLPVNERREWARGALGGDCRCKRCIWEASDHI